MEKTQFTAAVLSMWSMRVPFQKKKMQNIPPVDEHFWLGII